MSFRCAEEKQEEGEVGADEQDLDRSRQEQESSRIRLGLFLFWLADHDICDDIDAKFTALDKKYESNDWEIGEESPFHRYQVEIGNLNCLMDLIDQPGLKEKKRARNAALSKARGPAVKERNSGPLADHER